MTSLEEKKLGDQLFKTSLNSLCNRPRSYKVSLDQCTGLYVFFQIYSFQVPGWAFFLSALGLFIYQSLDAIDGKQARRTNSSSALGELFDHGCDAVSTGITS